MSGMNSLTKNQKIIAIVLGVIIAATGIFFGFRAIFGRAAGDEPKDVQVLDITQNSAKANWMSGTENQCTIKYGTSPTQLTFFAPETRETTQHSVDLTLLSPATTYNFKITCSDRDFDNNGVPWTFTTKDVQVAPTSVPTITSIPTSVPVSSTPAVSPTTTNTTCEEANKSNPVAADCDAIKTKLGKGCNTQDYFKCRKKITP